MPNSVLFYFLFTISIFKYLVPYVFLKFETIFLLQHIYFMVIFFVSAEEARSSSLFTF